MQEFLRAQGDSSTQHKVKNCPYEGCHKTFISAPGLRYHVKSHSSDLQPFLCHRCHKTFKSNNGLKYHQRKTNCEDAVADSPTDAGQCRVTIPAADQLDTEVKPLSPGSPGSGRRQPDPGGHPDPEFDGMDNLRELAIIATGPQSPLLRKTSQLPWDKPNTAVRSLDIGVEEECTCGQPRQSSDMDRHQHAVTSIAVAESDPKVTSSSPFPSSPKDIDSSEALWSHPWPTPVWQCFMKGCIIKLLSSTSLLDGDWHSTEELGKQQSLAEATQSARRSPSQLFCGSVGFTLTKLETSDQSDLGKVELYFQTDEDTPSVHLLARCAQDHPFFVKDKGWCSCSPHKTVEQYGIPCERLAEGDVCLPPSHPDAAFCTSYQLSPLDSTAVMALSSMAQQKKNQERQSALPSPDSPSKEEVFKLDSPTKAKRPMNAFMLFAKEYRIQYTQKYPGRDNRDISKLLGEEWNKLTPDDKKKFQEKAQILAKEQKQLFPDCWKRKK